MTKDDITRMAREAGFMPTVLNHWPAEFERFANLVAARSTDTEQTLKEKVKLATIALAEAYRCGYEAGVAAEREACADIVENAYTPDCGGWTAQGIADAIRERGTK